MPKNWRWRPYIGTSSIAVPRSRDVSCKESVSLAGACHLSCDLWRNKLLIIRKHAGRVEYIRLINGQHITNPKMQFLLVFLFSESSVSLTQNCIAQWKAVVSRHPLWIDVQKNSVSFSVFLPRCIKCQREPAMRKLSVRLSVRPSVCQTRDLWHNERKLCPRSYITSKIIHPSFVRRRMVGGGDPFYLKFRVNWPRWSEIADFQSIFARSASAVTPSEKFT